MTDVPRQLIYMEPDGEEEPLSRIANALEFAALTKEVDNLIDRDVPPSAREETRDMIDRINKRRNLLREAMLTNDD